MFKFGITTRITQAIEYVETRDSLARDWSVFFKREFPNDIWVSLPNIGNDAVNYFESLSLNVLILSGGDSLGKTPKRDETEYALLEYALKNSIPIIAICRGMQLVHAYFGGKTEKGHKEFARIHRAQMHRIITNEKDRFSVNSYHNDFIIEDSLREDLNIVARCEQDKTIEAFMNKRLIGLMWHPERNMESSEWSTKLIKNFLNHYHD